MADKNGSQAQHGFKKVAGEHTARFEAMQQEYAKLEAKGFEQSREAIDETAKIMKAGFDMAADLSAAWRQLAVEAMRRSTEMFTPRV